MTIPAIPEGRAAADPLVPTLFHEPWWLDIATGSRYDVAEVIEHGRVVGRMPYYLTKKAGFSYVDLPPLTHFLGPVALAGDGKPNTKFSRRFDITKELIRKLPKTSACYVKCHRDVTEVLAFQESGFRTGIQFTHEVPPKPLDEIWTNLRDTARNNIRTAREKYAINSGDDPELFMRFYASCIEQNKGLANNMHIGVHAKLIAASLEKGRGKIYEAREPNGSLASAIFCAWDRVSSYYLLTSRLPPAHRSSTSLLVWEAISDANKRDLIFDFDGIISEGGARAANNFTHIIKPRYTALRESAPLRILRAVKSVVRQPSFYY